jgi:hypothetical protein
MAGRLVAHVGAQYIDREGLKMLETPAATETWTPIPHYDLVTALEGQLKARGISILKEQFAIQKAKLFGVIDTDYEYMSGEGTAAIGLRTANDKSLALQLAIGYRVFVCDNMALYQQSCHQGQSSQDLSLTGLSLPGNGRRSVD